MRSSTPPPANGHNSPSKSSPSAAGKALESCETLSSFDSGIQCTTSSESVRDDANKTAKEAANIAQKQAKVHHSISHEDLNNDLRDNTVAQVHRISRKSTEDKRLTSQSAPHINQDDAGGDGGRTPSPECVSDRTRSKSKCHSTGDVRSATYLVNKESSSSSRSASSAYVANQKSCQEDDEQPTAAVSQKSSSPSQERERLLTPRVRTLSRHTLYSKYQ